MPHHLDPISESGAVQQPPLQPRRSLRPAAAPKMPASQQPRRFTLQPATLQAIEEANAGVGQQQKPSQLKTSRRRASSIRSSERSYGRQGPAGVAGPGQVENSYRLGPAQPFPIEAAQSLIQERLAQNLKGYTYNALSAKSTATNLVQEIKNKIKQQLLAGPSSRYKLIVMVTVADASTPAGELAARTLCHADTGDCATQVDFRTSRVAAWAAAFVFYFE